MFLSFAHLAPNMLPTRYHIVGTASVSYTHLFENSAVATAELQNSENQIDIFHTLSISNIPDVPVEDFFKVPFTHHSAIISGTKETLSRYYYIHRTVEEHLAVKKLLYSAVDIIIAC